MPALERATPPAESRLLRWVDLPSQDSGSELLIAPAPAVGDQPAGALDDYIKRLLRERDGFERQRSCTSPPRGHGEHAVAVGGTEGQGGRQRAARARQPARHPLACAR